MVVGGPQWLQAWGDGPHAGQDLDQHILPLLWLLRLLGRLADHGGRRSLGPQEVRQQALLLLLLLQQGISATYAGHAVLLLVVLVNGRGQLLAPEQVFFLEGPLGQGRGRHQGSTGVATTRVRTQLAQQALQVLLLITLLLQLLGQVQDWHRLGRMVMLRLLLLMMMLLMQLLLLAMLLLLLLRPTMDTRTQDHLLEVGLKLLNALGLARQGVLPQLCALGGVPVEHVGFHVDVGVHENVQDVLGGTIADGG